MVAYDSISLIGESEQGRLKSTILLFSLDFMGSKYFALKMLLEKTHEEKYFLFSWRPRAIEIFI